MGYDRPYHRVHGQVVAHELHNAYGAPVYGGTVPAQMFARILSNYRELQAPPALIGASPYPTPPVVTQKPTQTASPDATPTRRRPTREPIPTATSTEKPIPTASSSSRPLL
jgi:hypothetical protein